MATFALEWETRTACCLIQMRNGKPAAPLGILRRMKLLWLSLELPVSLGDSWHGAFLFPVVVEPQGNKPPQFSRLCHLYTWPRHMKVISIDQLDDKVYLSSTSPDKCIFPPLLWVRLQLSTALQRTSRSTAVISILTYSGPRKKNPYLQLRV